MISWINDKTYGLREWLAFKIFPEFDFYVEVAQRLGELNENSRAINTLAKEDSACSEWAISTLGFNNSEAQRMLDRLTEEYGEPPF